MGIVSPDAAPPADAFRHLVCLSARCHLMFPLVLPWNLYLGKIICECQEKEKGACSTRNGPWRYMHLRLVVD